MLAKEVPEEPGHEQKVENREKQVVNKVPENSFRPYGIQRLLLTGTPDGEVSLAKTSIPSNYKTRNNQYSFYGFRNFLGRYFHARKIKNIPDQGDIDT